MDLDFVSGGDLSHGDTPPVGENIFRIFLELFPSILNKSKCFFWGDVASFRHDRNN